MQDVVVVAGQGLVVGEQIVDQLMQRDFDVTVGGLGG